MADLPESSSAPADDFIHVSLDKSATSLTGSYSSNKSQYSQVVFHDLSEVYPTDGDITFTYSFQSGVIPQVGDRIALYKVGWSSVSEFITSVFAKLPEGGLPISDKIIKISFPVENLPKDEVNMYQFCYITSGNIVAGSSIPFTFRKPHGSELVAVEDPNDSGLVVFRSRVTQLQEQLEKNNTEKETLEKTIDELKSEMYLMKTEKAKKCELHVEHIEYLTNVAYDLNNEKKSLLQKHSAMSTQIEELENSKESLLKDIDKLKENIEVLQADIEAKNETILDLNEKFNKAGQSSLKLEETQKIKEALEIDLMHLKNKKQVLTNDLICKDAIITELTESKKALEIEIKRLKDELKDSGENFNQIAEAMKAQENIVAAEVEKLAKKLKDMTEQNNANGVESLNLTRDLEKANNQIKSLTELVNNKDRILKDILDASNGENDLSGKMILMQDENSLLQVQVLSLEEKVLVCEVQNRKAKEEIEDLKIEKLQMSEQLSKMNETLRNLQSGTGPIPRPRYPDSSYDGQRSQSAFAHLSQFLPFFNQLPGPIVARAASANNNATCQTPGPSTAGTQECAKCIEASAKVKELLKEKSDVRSALVQSRHANEEYNKQLQEVSEEAAALRSRVAVLEIELRKAKEVSPQKEQPRHDFSLVFGPREEDETSVNKELYESLEKERETKALLQRNVESLMILEAKNFVTIDKLKKENAQLSLEITRMKDSLVGVDELRKALDDVDSSNKEMVECLQTLNNEKLKLEKQLIDLRKESVGKVTLITVQELQDENERLKHQIIQGSIVNGGEASGLRQVKPRAEVYAIPTAPVERIVNGTTSLMCPICDLTFPPDSTDAYNKHISDHFD